MKFQSSTHHALATLVAACSLSAATGGGVAMAAQTSTNSQGQTVECTNDTTTTTSSTGTNSIIGTVAGGALGGLAGNQFGKGKGKTAMTAVGAVGGAVAGHEVAKDHYPDKKSTTTQHCTPVNN